jgi:acyl phosphate:glycerol-3-phosphate acyltransferase
MSLVLVLVFALAGYFVGSFSFSRLFVRIFAPNCDVNKLEAKTEDGEAMKMLTYGANAVSLVLGTKLSMVVSLLDLLKIAVPMLILKLLYGTEPYYLFYSCTGLIGNNWPLFYRFKGGTGFSVILGSLLIVDYWAVIATPLLGLLLGVFALGNIGIANLGWIILVIPWLWIGNFELNVVVYAVVIAIIAFITLLPEVRRYIEYSRQGKLEALGKSYYDSSSMARGMKKIMDRRNSLGKWKHVLTVSAIVLFIMVYYLEYLLR